MYGKVGMQSLASGGVGPLRLDTTGALITASTGKYKDAALAGRVYVAANQAAVAFTEQFTLAYTGLVLENPADSGKNFTLLEAGFAFTVAASAATVMGIMTGYDAGDAAAAITPRNRLKGGAASVAVVDNACTLVGVPVLEQVFAAVSTATTAVPNGTMSRHDLEGSLILAPGYYVAFYSWAAVTASPLCYFMWEEDNV